MGYAKATIKSDSSLHNAKAKGVVLKATRPLKGVELELHCGLGEGYGARIDPLSYLTALPWWYNGRCSPSGTGMSYGGAFGFNNRMFLDLLARA